LFGFPGFLFGFPYFLIWISGIRQKKQKKFLFGFPANITLTRTNHTQLFEEISKKHFVRWDLSTRT
jgi:hypothetical protein